MKKKLIAESARILETIEDKLLEDVKDWPHDHGPMPESIEDTKRKLEEHTYAKQFRKEGLEILRGKASALKSLQLTVEAIETLADQLSSEVDDDIEAIRQRIRQFSPVTEYETTIRPSDNTSLTLSVRNEASVEPSKANKAQAVANRLVEQAFSSVMERHEELDIPGEVSVTITDDLGTMGNRDVLANANGGTITIALEPLLSDTRSVRQALQNTLLHELTHLDDHSQANTTYPHPITDDDQVRQFLDKVRSEAPTTLQDSILDTPYGPGNEYDTVIVAPALLRHWRRNPIGDTYKQILRNLRQQPETAGTRSRLARSLSDQPYQASLFINIVRALHDIGGSAHRLPRGDIERYLPPNEENKNEILPGQPYTEGDAVKLIIETTNWAIRLPSDKSLYISLYKTIRSETTAAYILGYKAILDQWGVDDPVLPDV